MAWCRVILRRTLISIGLLRVGELSPFSRERPRYLP